MAPRAHSRKRPRAAAAVGSVPVGENKWGTTLFTPGLFHEKAQLFISRFYSRRVSQINKPRYRNQRALPPWGSRRACVHYKSQQCRSPKPGRVAAPLLFLILEKRSEPALRLATHRTASALRTRAPPPALFPFRRTPQNAPQLSPQNPPTTTTSGTAAGGVSEKARMHSRRDA